MLYVYFGDINWDTCPLEYVYNIDKMFDFAFESSWTDNEFSKRVISEVDRSTLISPKIIDSPWLDIIPITQASGGSKQLIMADATDGLVFNGNNFGDNCYNLLYEISKTKDIAMSLTYFPDLDKLPADFTAFIINSNKVVTSSREFTASHMSDKNLSEVDFKDVDWHINVDYGYFDRL